MEAAKSGRRKRSLEGIDDVENNKRNRTDSLRGSRMTSKGTPSRVADWVRNQQSPKPTAAIETTLGRSTVKKAQAAAETPARLKQMTRKLPCSYALLVDIFGKLQTVYLLYKRRNQRCTFQNAKKPVEDSCGREFLVKHLLQLKELLPEDLKLTSSSGNLPSTPGGTTKSEAQTFIEMPRLAERAGSQAASQELREELADKLTGLMKAHHGRQHPSCNPEPEGTECGFDPESCPEPLIASMPLPANLCCSPASPAVSAPHTPSTAHPRPTPLSSSRKPPTGLRSSRPLAKRLQFGGTAEQAQLSGASQPDAKEFATRLADVLEEDDGPTSANEARLAKELRRQSMDGSIPVSLQALQAVRKASEEQAAMFNAEAVAARRDATAVALLPKLFDSVRAVFGPSGPSVIQLQKVVQRLGSGKSDDNQQAEVRYQLQCLAECLPDFLTIESRPEQGEVLKINRSLDPKTMRENLMSMSSSS